MKKPADSRGNESADNGRLHIVHITTVGSTAKAFLGGHFLFLRSLGHDVTLVCRDDSQAHVVATETGVGFRPLPLERTISPLADVVNVVRLVRLLGQLNPDVVHTHTPKGGIIGMTAARLLQLKVRVYSLHGLAFETRRGLTRSLMRMSDRWSTRFATCVLPVSESLMQKAAEEKICSPEKLRLIGKGSISGVDVRQFSVTPYVLQQAKKVRDRFNIPEGAVVFGYVGRLVQDKGVEDLAKAWRLVSAELADAHLILVGPWEDHGREMTRVREMLNDSPRVHQAGWQDDVVPFLAAMSVFVLPSHREGFPVSALEASALSIPTIATRVTGCIDAVRDNVTGLLVPPRNPAALASAMSYLSTNESLRHRFGAAARVRVLSEFDPQIIWAATAALYEELRQQSTG